MCNCAKCGELMPPPEKEAYMSDDGPVCFACQYKHLKMMSTMSVCLFALLYVIWLVLT